MWTPKGRTKSVHNSEVSTLVKLGVAMGHRLVPFRRSHMTYYVHVENVSTGVGCPQKRGVHKVGVYCNY